MTFFILILENYIIPQLSGVREARKWFIMSHEHSCGIFVLKGG